MLKRLLIFSLFISSFSTYSQEGGGQGGDVFLQQSVQDISTVGFTSLGGAILGLSTLSFVDEPKYHYNNIVVGGAIGLIVGVCVVAFKQASSSKNQYMEQGSSLDFKTNERVAYFQDKRKKRNTFSVSSDATQLNYGFTF